MHFLGKTRCSHGPLFAFFFKHSGIARLLSLLWFPKLIKSEIVWLFSEIRCSHGCFLAFFTQENTLLSCPYLVKICSKNDLFFFLHWFPHFLLITKKMRAFELLSSIAMVLWNRFLPFFHKSKLPALIPFLVKISWKYDFSIFFIAAHYSLLKTEEKIDIFAFFSKILCSDCFFTFFTKPITNYSHALLEGVFVIISTVSSQRKISFSVYNCLVRGYPQISLLSWAFGRPYGWYLQNLKLTKLPQNYWKCENHSALTTNFCFKLGKGWKSQYALGRVLRFSAKKLPW